MVTKTLPDLTVVREIFPQRDSISEQDACAKLCGSTDIMVDVYLHSGRNAVEDMANDVVTWADSDDAAEPTGSSSATGRYNSVDEYIYSARRRVAICEYRRMVLARCTR